MKMLHSLVSSFGTLLIALLGWSCSHANTLNQTTGWSGKEADIYFLLDGSSSWWIGDYREQLKFVANLVSEMDIRPEATRVGVGIYSASYYPYISLNNNLTKDMLISMIREAPLPRGDGYLSRALQGMREVGLSSNITRTGVPLIAGLFTDGAARYHQLTIDNATLAKRDGIFIFTVGIGNDINEGELRIIASDPKEDYYFYVPDFDSLPLIRTKLSSKMSEVTFLQGDKGSCGEQTQVDVVFVYDEAGLGSKDAQKVKSFLQSTAEDLSMNSGNIRVGVVSKTCHEGDIMLGQYVTKEDFIKGLAKDDGQEISVLVKRATQSAFQLEKGARLDARRRIVLILHAPMQNFVKRDDTMREILRAKYAGTEVFVIRLGTNYDKVFLNRLASSPDNVLYFASTDELLEGKSIFLSSFCKDL